MPLPAEPWPGAVAGRILTHAGGGRTAVCDGARTWTFDELALRAERVAHRLGGTAGLGGTHVALLATPDADWVASLLGIWLAGGVAVPLSPQYPGRELAWFCDDAAVQTAIVSPEYRALADELRPGRLLCEPAALSAVGVPARAATEPEPGAVAVLVYTSGTTGKPKGALLTHGGLAVQTRVLAQHWGVVDDDRLLHALPLHHVHGLVVALLTALAAGASVQLLPRFDVAAVVAGLADATVWMAVPTMYQKLRAATAAPVANAVARLRLATSGSAALPVATAAWWESLTGAIPLERYGMTETGIVLSNPLEIGERRAGLVGAPLPTFDVRLVPDAGADAVSGPGELEVRGPSLFAGYWRRPGATAAAYASGGWFRTGDRAVRSPDGAFRLLGRTSVDVIKSGGYKLSAVEIEDVLRQHPAIDDVAVVGVPDEIWGESVVAAVVAAQPLDPEAVRVWARDHLAAYQVPKVVVQMADLPRNPLGKCVKPALLALLARRRQAP